MTGNALQNVVVRRITVNSINNSLVKHKEDYPPVLMYDFIGMRHSRNASVVTISEFIGMRHSRNVSVVTM